MWYLGNDTVKLPVQDQYQDRSPDWDQEKNLNDTKYQGPGLEPELGPRPRPGPNWTKLKTWGMKGEKMMRQH